MEEREGERKEGKKGAQVSRCDREIELGHVLRGERKICVMRDMKEDTRATRGWEINTCVAGLNDKCARKLLPRIKDI